MQRLRHVPAWAWVSAIVLASFALRAWVARGMLAPFIMVDELVYSELAKSFAASGHLRVRDAAGGGYGVLYPVLISPAYALFDRVPDAYAAVKTINALAMSVAAVPAYLVARRVLPTAWALFAALFAVALPSLVYTTTVMTENLFYPLFLFAAWALVLVLERPDATRTTLLAVLVLLAFAVRVQGLALVPAILTAPPLFVLLGRRAPRELLPFAPLYVIAGAGAVLLAEIQALRGRSLNDLLGAYAVVGESSYDIGRVLHFWLWHVEELDLYLGIAPMAALLVLLALASRQPRPIQAFLAATISLTFWLSLVVAAFASRFADRIQERNLFFVAPLVLVALLVWARRGSPRALLVPVLAVAVALPLLFPYGRFIDTGAISDTLALLPIWSAFGSLLFGSIVASVAAGAIVVAVAMIFVPPRWAVAVPLLVLAYFAVIGRSVWSGERGFERAGAGALFQGIRGVPRDWIDRALPNGASAAAIWTGRLDRLTINENEFFNRSVGRIYYTSAPTPGGTDETRVTIDHKSGVVREADGASVRDRYVLLDSTGAIDPDGTPLARDPLLGLTLWRVNLPLITRTTVSGLYRDDTWSGRTVTYTRRRCRGGALVVTLASDPSLFSGPTEVVAERRRVRFGPTGQARLKVPLQPRGGTCVVRFTVSPTAIPKEVLAGSKDSRVLGAHFTAFIFQPSRAS